MAIGTMVGAVGKDRCGYKRMDLFIPKEANSLLHPHEHKNKQDDHPPPEILPLPKKASSG
jgi:hypothetical protein